MHTFVFQKQNRVPKESKRGSGERLQPQKRATTSTYQRHQRERRETEGSFFGRARRERRDCANATLRVKTLYGTPSDLFEDLQLFHFYMRRGHFKRAAKAIRRGHQRGPSSPTFAPSPCRVARLGCKRYRVSGVISIKEAHEL